MKSFEQFIIGLDGQQKAIVSFFHQRLTARHGLIATIKYNIPFYQYKSSVCYLNPIKNDGIELAFLRGSELSNEQGLLDLKSRKMVAGVSLFDVNDIPEKAIDEIVQEALLLEEMKG